MALNGLKILTLSTLGWFLRFRLFYISGRFVLLSIRSPRNSALTQSAHLCYSLHALNLRKYSLLTANRLCNIAIAPSVLSSGENKYMIRRAIEWAVVNWSERRADKQIDMLAIGPYAFAKNFGEVVTSITTVVSIDEDAAIVVAAIACKDPVTATGVAEVISSPINRPEIASPSWSEALVAPKVALSAESLQKKAKLEVDVAKRVNLSIEDVRSTVLRSATNRRNSAMYRYRTMLSRVRFAAGAPQSEVLIKLQVSAYSADVDQATLAYFYKQVVDGRELVEKLPSSNQRNLLLLLDCELLSDICDYWENKNPNHEKGRVLRELAERASNQYPMHTANYWERCLSSILFSREQKGQNHG